MRAARSVDCCHVVSSGRGPKVQNDRPHVAVLIRRHDIAADITGKFGKSRIVPSFPFRESIFATGTNFRGGDQNGRRTHLLLGTFNSANWAKIRSALNGRLVNRIPVASARALPNAGETGMIGASPIGFAPNGP